MRNLLNWLETSIGAGWECRLFINDPEPMDALQDRGRSWFVEPSYDGYHAVPIGFPTRWDRSIDGGGVIEFAPVTFESVDATVYGWFVVETGRGGSALLLGQIGRSWRPKTRKGSELRIPIRIDLRTL